MRKRESRQSGKWEKRESRQSGKWEKRESRQSGKWEKRENRQSSERKKSGYDKGGKFGHEAGRFCQTLLRALYPPRCVCCDALLPIGEDGCCPVCAAKLPRIRGPVCMKCGKPVAQEQEYCEDCRSVRHEFDCGAAAFTYSGSLRQSVYRMKTQNRRDYLPFYAREMAEALEPHLSRWRPQAIVPVPMHPRKRRRRGYNQSELLAKELGRLTGIPVRPDLLRCVKLTSAQKTLDRKERRKNLKGSFAASGHLPESLSRILLADDVYTTGSTMDEAASALKQAGAQRIFFVVLCIGKGKV